MNSLTDKRRALTELGLYFGLTFMITWGLGAAIIFARPQLEAWLGPLGPLNRSWLYYLAVYAPSISAVTLSLAFGGLKGLGGLLAGLVRPVRLLWIALAILTYPAGLLMLGLFEQATGARIGGAPIDLHALLVGAPLMLFATTAAFTDPGGFGEEAGWRGYALPRLLVRFEAAPAALILGVIWMVWHIPAFLVAGLAQSTMDFGWFLAGGVAMTVFMTWIYVHANGNFLVAGVIPHLLFNLGFDAHVTRSLQAETVVLGVIAVGLLAAFGPSLKGWRGDRRGQALAPANEP